MNVDVMEGIKCLGGCGTVQSNGLPDAKQKPRCIEYDVGPSFSHSESGMQREGKGYVVERITIATPARRRQKGMAYNRENCVRGVPTAVGYKNWKRQ
jgi:hypothetical protein